MSDHRFVLALSGAPASGKTTVARAVADQTGARRVAFGDFVRREAARRSVDTNRGALQQLGQALLDELGPKRFCRAALDAAGATPEDRPVIWDGVRHPVILGALAHVYDAPITLVYLDPPRDDRRARFAREAHSVDELERWERDATERHGAELIGMANLVCAAEQPDQVVAEIITALSTSP